MDIIVRGDIDVIGSWNVIGFSDILTLFNFIDSQYPQGNSKLIVSTVSSTVKVVSHWPSRPRLGNQDTISTAEGSRSAM